MHYILVSHGPFARAALESAEMIVGQQEHVSVLEVGHDTTLDGMTNEIKEVIAEHSEKEFIILCDILGGTPSNASVKVLHDCEQAVLVTGFNLPLLLELFMNQTQDKEQLLDSIKTTYEQSLHIIEDPRQDKQEIENYEL